jgi:undecaprenyl-diphosphatase
MTGLLHAWDVELFRLINGAHLPWLDPVMAGISSKALWIPAYALAAWWIWRREGARGLALTLAAAALLITLSDQTASGLLKPWAARYRPCRPEAGLPFTVHTVEGRCGGAYGFASSHAANFFALAAWLSGRIRKRGFRLAAYAAALLVAWSRVYLGVHYPGDVVAGAAIGLLSAGLVLLAHCWAARRLGLAPPG